MTDSVKKMIRKFGLPRIIIVLFFSVFGGMCRGIPDESAPVFQ